MSTRSYVELFSGNIDKDGRSVDELIKEVEWVLSTGNQSPYEQFGFLDDAP